MIKITNNHKKPIECFNTLWSGDTFLYDGCLYIKTAIPGGYNAFCLSGPDFCAKAFSDLTEVEPVDTHIIID